MTITRRTLGEGPREVQIVGPDGVVSVQAMEELAPGRFVARYEAPDIGLYRLKQGEAETVIALGPAAPREFEETIATSVKLAPPVGATRGGILALEAGLPDLRTVRAGRPAAGRGWIGLTPRDAYLTTDVTIRSLVPGWLLLILVSALSVAGWLYEGRR